MSPDSLQLLLFTQADVGGCALFRVVPVELRVGPGQGCVWLDASRGSVFTPVWQRHVQHLAALGRARYALPWEQTDLHVRARGGSVTLDGRSASLPLFVAWVALLSGRPLPSPFLGTGVALEEHGERLAPAPREFLQGKLGVAQSYVKQVFPQAGRVAVYVPEDSGFDAHALTALDVRPVPTLTRAVSAVLGLEPRADAAAVTKPEAP
ncbi:hypothetical protein OV207_15355 [Corallococcus sp. BB11-1]|uniref:hypothetical protein n=1 Tax=Corallococcus sp. BB11-1 TaxID=2996783 RepID=UPI0010D98F7C|nr:hypothetical protein [Corallococcus sp. BB11-1]MCY1032846.1 hypothetical protein [Corallococcus sp. BB11-1]RYZ45085.1 MAG: hypothetical protein EOO72_04850 [Myxococcaceae bacterium]